MDIKQGQDMECRVESLAYGGRGLARVEGMAVFIEGGLPGQKVRARVVKAKKRHAEAEVLEVLEPSGNEVEPFCAHFPACGGCAHQHLAYAEQLAWKERQLLDSLGRIGKVEPRESLPALASPRTAGYRNKMAFSFAGRGGSLVLGLNARGSGRIVNLDSCPLMPEAGSKLMRAVRDFCRQHRLDAYNPRVNKGFLRRLIVRSDSSGHLVAHLIVFPDRRNLSRLENLAALLPDAGLILSTRRARSDLAEAEHTVFTHGDTELNENVLGLDFRISAHSFFQTNTGAAEVLCRTVMDWAEPGPDQTVFDLYSGAGLFSLALAQRAGRVVGFERSQSAVDDAAHNARANNIANVEFVAGPLERTCRAFADHPKPHTIILDPPRAGVAPEVLEAALALKPQRIVYISCDPATLARDAQRISQTHTPAKTRAADLFPHTPSLESITLFVL